MCEKTSLNLPFVIWKNVLSDNERLVSRLRLNQPYMCNVNTCSTVPSFLAAAQGSILITDTNFSTDNNNTHFTNLASQ